MSEQVFHVGQRVRTRHSPFGTPSRRGKIKETYVNQGGMTCFRLEDGGMFSANELINDELKGKAVAK